MALLFLFLSTWLLTPNCIYQQKINQNSQVVNCELDFTNNKKAITKGYPHENVDNSCFQQKKTLSFFVKGRNNLIQELNKELEAYYTHFRPEKTYIHIDKTLVEPGEDIWFTVYLRDAQSLKAAESDIVYFEWIAPNGTILKKNQLIAKNGMAKGDLTIGKQAKGGIYTLRAYSNHQRNTAESFERKIQVQTSYLPNLRLKLEFDRKAYSAGDLVKANFSAKTLENTDLSNFAYEGIINIDGKEYTKIKGTSDQNGLSKVQFNLPKDLNTTDGLVNILLNYENQNESISRTIPIVLNKIDLQFFPEGGDLVAGINQQVAFKAINEFGKVADVEGIIYTEDGTEVSNFKSYHDGMGASNFTALVGKNYYAQLTNPKGIAKKYPLPKTLANGFALQVQKQEKNKLCVQIATTESAKCHLVLQMRGSIAYSKMINVSSKEDLEIDLANLPIGIAQLTLFDAQKRPQADRLVFINPHHQLNFNLKTDQEKYLPREKVKMTVEVTNEKNEPVQTAFSLAVSDDQLLSFADDKQGHILSHILLESDLKGTIEEPNFYFDKPELHPEKDQNLALDYLLMTQGWRHFSWKNTDNQTLASLPYATECANIGGIVVNRFGKKVKNAKVVHSNTGQRTKTDAEGYFLFENVAVSSIQIQKGQNRYYGKVQEHGQNQVFALEKINYKEDDFEIKTYPKKKSLSIYGSIVDAQHRDALLFANVILYKNGKVVGGLVSDIDGNFKCDNLPQGVYDVEVQYVGYTAVNISNLHLKYNETTELNIAMQNGATLQEIVVIDYKAPMIERDRTMSASVVKSEKKSKRARKKVKQEAIKESNSSKIATLPTKNINGLAATTAGLASVDDGEALSIRGSRSATTDYYVDGIRVRAAKMIPQEKPMPQVLAGIPAEFEQEEDMELDWDAGVSLDEIVVVNYNVPMIEQDNTTQGRIITYEDIRPRSIGGYGRSRRNTQIHSFGVSKDGSTTQQEKGPAYPIYTARNFYSPQYRAQEMPETRTDFRNTIYWNPMIETNEKGKATISFYNSDAITTFKASVEGFGTNGEIGRTTHTYYTQLPFQLQSKVPNLLLIEDEVSIPVTLKNNTNEAVKGNLILELPDGLELLSTLEESYSLAANAVETIYLSCKASKQISSLPLKISFHSNTFVDAFEEKISIIPRGFPVQKVISGQGINEKMTINIHEQIEGSMKAVFSVYPNVADNIMGGMERMLRQPTGCFEQTSSANYPNLLVLDYLQSTGQNNKEVEKKAKDFLTKGYNRLIGFEVSGGGFDWYGRPPGHEALTAYGLMQFVDMQTVHPVDKNLIERTAKWLLGQRDGKGGWKNSKRALHRWEGENDISTAYIAWALTEAGFGSQIQEEIEVVYKNAVKKQDPYLLGLLANSLQNMKDNRADSILEKILELQEKEGNWNGKTFSMTHSTGISLTVETTALCVLALLNSKENRMASNKAIDFLQKSKTSHGFGSTQSTVLAMKALIQHAKQNQTPKEDGIVQLMVDGEIIAEKEFYANESEDLIFDISKKLGDGSHEIKLKFLKIKEGLPYDLHLEYTTRLPQNTSECAVNVDSELSDVQLNVGATSRLQTKIKNTTNEPLPNTIAVIGIPSGMSVQHWQLKELQEKAIFDYYELMEGYLVFHYRGLNAGEEKTINLDLKAELVGLYEAPASSTYLYYTNEFKNWDEPLQVRINP